MSYQISQTAPSALSTEELFAEIQSFKALAAEVVARYSLILDELKRRRQSHAFMRHPVLSFFREIAADELAPEASPARKADRGSEWRTYPRCCAHRHRRHSQR